MKYDVFFSISQTEVEGYTPDSRTMFQNFFDQVVLADELSYGTAWVAETHLSCQTQKKTSFKVIPEFQGEIGLNTNILQLAPLVYEKTKNIRVGSAIQNILCNGGPIAHAEDLLNFMALKEQSSFAERELEIGFAAGRFEFANAPYKVFPRNPLEKTFWHLFKTKALEEAAEIYLRLLTGEELSSFNVVPKFLNQSNFRSEEDWLKASMLAREEGLYEKGEISVKKFFDFEILSLIPVEADFSTLQFTVGSHDSAIQEHCNRFFPVRVFSLSITPPQIIEETHLRMQQMYHKDGGPWRRWYMPRTAMIFLNDDSNLDSAQQSKKAKEKAQKAWENYWKAMAGTIDQKKVEEAVDNTIYGSVEEVAEKICLKYHPHDRLMLWFDFNNHDNEDVKKSMITFREKVVPLIESYGRD